MVRNRVVLGDNKIISLQNAIASTMGSLRRGAVNFPTTTLRTDRCVGCNNERLDCFDTSNIMRCSALQDRFIWVCPDCSGTRPNHT